jgi:hypothetical protein
MSAPRLAAVTRSSAIGYWSASIGSLAGGGAGRVTSQTVFTGFQEFLGPGVIQALGDGFAAAKGGDTCLAAQPFQNDADLVLGRMFLARGATNIADKLFGRNTDRRGGGILAHLHSPWGYDELEILRYSN